MEFDIQAWDGLVLGCSLTGGARNEVWDGVVQGERVVVRRSRRSAESLAWELDLMKLLDDRGFRVPLPVPTTLGALAIDGVVVQRWLDGREPESPEDWVLVADELQRLHSTCGDVTQRPGCYVVTELTSTSVSVDADLSELPDDVAALVLGVFRGVDAAPVSLIHGDPGAPNIRICPDGRVGVLDWDESRVDVIWHDLSNLGIRVLSGADHARARRLSDAWEAVNGWSAEPKYARHRLSRLTDTVTELSVAGGPDAVFADRRLAPVYDVFEGERDDLDAYELIVDELGARSMLDVGCGTGELACRLARRGIAVTAVDPAAASVDVAKSKPGAGSVTWVVGEATTMQIGLPPIQVDLATMTANVAQVFLTDEQWSANLGAIRRSLRPGGHLVFETRIPSIRAWERWTPTETRARAAVLGDTVETWCEVTLVDDPFVTFRWTNVFESDRATVIPDSTLRFRNRDEVEQSLAVAGFEVIDVRDAPDRPGKEMVFVVRRI